MGKNLIETDEMILTRFYGGVDRGTCYQLNICNHKTGKWEYVQLTSSQVFQLVKAFLK